MAEKYQLCQILYANWSQINFCLKCFSECPFWSIFSEGRTAYLWFFRHEKKASKFIKIIFNSCCKEKNKFGPGIKNFFSVSLDLSFCGQWKKAQKASKKWLGEASVGKINLHDWQISNVASVTVDFWTKPRSHFPF